MAPRNKPMKALLFLSLATALTANAQVGAYNIAKDQARRASAANTAEQQRIDNASRDPAHPAPAAPSTPPADPVLGATMKNISDLQVDVTGLNRLTSGEASAAQKAALLNDLNAASAGKKASAASVQKLSEHLIVAVSGKKNAAPQVLARNIHALFNGKHLTDVQVSTLTDAVKKNLQAAGASEAEAESVVQDLKLIAAETK